MTWDGDSLKKYRKSAILYIKVFIVIFIIGFLLPGIISFVLNHIIPEPRIKSPDNYLFVLNHLNRSKSFYEIFFEILGKVIEF